MAFQHSIRYVYSTNSGVIVDAVEAVTGSQQGVDIDTVIQPEVQNEFDINVTTSRVQSMLLWCDQPAELVTNDPAAPDNTVPMKASIPIIWTLNSFWPNVFKSGTISKIFVKNMGAVPGNLKIRMLSN